MECLLFATKLQNILAIREKGIVISFRYPIYHLSEQADINAFFKCNLALSDLRESVTYTENYIIDEDLKLLDWGLCDDEPELIYVFKGENTDRIYLVPAVCIAHEIARFGDKAIVLVKSTSRFLIETVENRKIVMDEIKAAELEDFERAKSAGCVTYEMIDGEEYPVITSLDY